jgi:signal transduction histidine kinase/DNA-binding response OmpR family regulator
MSGQGTGDCAAAERSSILIVDDLPGQRLVLETILGDLGQDLVFANSGSEALREVLRREFAVILLDVNMPDIDGFETATLIRRYKRSAHTPIIFVTAYADEIQTARGYSLGAVDYILAPVVPDVLRSKIKVFVDLHVMQRQIRRQADERVALAAAEAAQRAAEQNTLRSNFLSGASRVLSASLDIEVGKRSLLQLIVPEIADAATLVLFEDDGSFSCASSCGLDESRVRVVSAQCVFDELAPSVRDALSAAVATGKRVALGPERRSVSVVDTRPTHGKQAAFPLIAGERALGALWVRLNDAPEVVATLEELATRAAVAFENARLYRNLQAEVLERQQTEALLQKADQRKDEFLAMLSHELRNPLAPIRNAVEVIRMVAPSEPKLSWATDVTERQVGHLARLIDELLDVARISQGKIVLRAEPLDLLEAVAHGVETARPLIDSRRHVLTEKIPPGPIWLRGDSARLSQVISNLLNNAAKYTEEGGAIHLAVSVEDGYATIAVRDNGIGIDADLLPKVFDLFKQGEQTLDRAQGGLGVGLTLAQRLAELHNGRVEASSGGAGMGAEFRLVLPCLTEVRQSSNAGDQTVEAQREGPVKCRVLVVDDNIDAAETVAVFLELAGHQVKAVTDGAQALACAPVFAPEVVVLDIGLPGMDGYQVARRLRVTEQTQTALLIALTGYGQDTDRERAQQAGFDHHLVKPADPGELARMIMDWRAGPDAGRERHSRLGAAKSSG